MYGKKFALYTKKFLDVNPLTILEKLKLMFQVNTNSMSYVKLHQNSLKSFWYITHK